MDYDASTQTRRRKDKAVRAYKQALQDLQVASTVDASRTDMGYAGSGAGGKCACATPPAANPVR